MIINGQIINDDLAQIQRDIVALLRGDPALGFTPVYKFKDFVPQDVAFQNQNIWADVSGGLAGVATDAQGDQVFSFGSQAQGKRGTAIEVRMPAVRPSYPNEPGPQLMLEQTVRIMEDAAENSTGITCESLGLEVLAWLDGMAFTGLDGAVYTLTALQGGLALKPVYHEYVDRFVYDVVFTARLPRTAKFRAQTPVPSDDGAGNVTLAVGDGSAIYFTLDGSAPIIPVPGKNPVAPTQLYAAPFEISSGTTVTAIAWMPGALPSAMFRGTLTY